MSTTRTVGSARAAVLSTHVVASRRCHALGIDEFVLSGCPHLEEAYRVGEGLLPELDRRGLLAPRPQ